MRVRPAVPGTVIRDPHTKRRLPDEGAKVPKNSYWLRRLRDGDVVLVDDPAAPTGMEPVAPLTTRDAAPPPLEHVEKHDPPRPAEQPWETRAPERPSARKSSETAERTEKKSTEFRTLDRPEKKS